MNFSGLELSNTSNWWKLKCVAHRTEYEFQYAGSYCEWANHSPQNTAQPFVPISINTLRNSQTPRSDLHVTNADATRSRFPVFAHKAIYGFWSPKKNSSCSKKISGFEFYSYLVEENYYYPLSCMFKSFTFAASCYTNVTVRKNRFWEQNWSWNKYNFILSNYKQFSNKIRNEELTFPPTVVD